MMRVSPVAFAFAALMAVSACGSDTHRRASDETVIVTLDASPRNAGRTGKAYLVPQRDDTVVTIVISGINAPVTVPVRLFMFVYDGRCGALAAEPTWKLTQRLAPESPADLPPGRGPLTLANTLPASLDVVRQAPRALVVRSTVGDGDLELFCGNL
jgi:hypothetical protein